MLPKLQLYQISLLLQRRGYLWNWMFEDFLVRNASASSISKASTLSNALPLIENLSKTGNMFPNSWLAWTKYKFNKNTDSGMLPSNQRSKNNLPRVIASVLFVDLENLTRGFDRLLKEAYSRFSSFPTAIRRQNLEIRHDYKCGNPDQENAKDIYIAWCMILD